jgi:triphosphoribosyl-dephospho-CoA synthase
MTPLRAPSRAEPAERAESGRLAFLWACALDVQACKPGNVSVSSPGHGMDAGLFLASAAAAAGPISSAGAPVGERIEAAVRAGLQVAHCNTNLGIVLLCAPLLAAFERADGPGSAVALRCALASVLRALDVADARAAYRASAAASPAGLGRASEQDVMAVPTVGLRDAMGLAADRDRIAWQYQHDYLDVFELGLPAFLGARCAGAADGHAMQATFLEFAAALPDSHIVRKHGGGMAQSVLREAAAWRAIARRGGELDADPAFARWDQDLKARGLNPGTSADLCVAVAMTAALLASA